MKKLAIKDLAEQTGVAAGTIRMWEQRYGFPEPARTAAGYRIYTEQDVVALRRVVAYRRPRALRAGGARAGALAGGRDRPPVDLRRAAVGRRAGAPAEAAQADADRALAGDRGGGDRARRRAGRDRRLPGRAQLPRRRAPLPAPGARRRRGRRVRDFDELHVGDEDEPAEIPIGADRRARPRVGGDRRRARLRRLPRRLGDAATPASGSSRRSGRWTRRRPPRRAGRRRARRAQRAGVVRAPARRCSPTARSPSRRRRPVSRR